ncbi:hypothetical protein ES703_103910 [subsurface metagenome]
MPDYRAYKMNDHGEMVEVPPEGLGEFMGISEFDANLMLRGMNIVKTICVIAGEMESPALIWNENMPASLVEFVTEHVAGQLKANPAWSIKDFDWALLYDGDELKYRT